MDNDAISRSAVLELSYFEITPNHGCPSVALVVDVEDIEKLPAVDAVPVVRCKDCKWWGLPEGMYATENVKHCELGRYMVASNGYCVYGEVKDNAAD